LTLRGVERGGLEGFINELFVKSSRHREREIVKIINRLFRNEDIDPATSRHACRLSAR
jgi:hypothetical protein